MEGMELAPSETSSQHNAHISEEADLQVRTNPPTPQILLSAGQFNIKQGAGSTLPSGNSTARQSTGPFILQAGHSSVESSSTMAAAHGIIAQTKIAGSDMPQ